MNDARRQVISDYLQAHDTHYQGKYRFKCGYHSGDGEYKCIYYLVDVTMRELTIFVDVHVNQTCKVDFSVDLNEEEREAITVNVLQKILLKSGYDSALHWSLYDKYLDLSSDERYQLLPVDYLDIFGYIRYHRGINQKSIDAFYDVLMPALGWMLEKKNYATYLETMCLILNDIAYVHEWDLSMETYVSSEYQYHLYYIRGILKTFYARFEDFYNADSDLCEQLVVILCENPRFALHVLVNYLRKVLHHSDEQDEMMQRLEKRYTVYDMSERRSWTYNMIFSYLFYMYIGDDDSFRGVIREVLRKVMSNCLRYVNHDLDIALGNALVGTMGYEILLEIFSEDYNTFLFTVFPIDTFPNNLQINVRDQLVEAILFFSARMDNEKYKQSSFEQILNINRLLIFNFRDWYNS